MAFVRLGNKFRNQVVIAARDEYVEFYDGAIPTEAEGTCGSLLGTGSVLWSASLCTSGTSPLISPPYTITGVNAGTINIGRIRSSSHLTQVVGYAGTAATCDFVLTDAVISGVGSTTHLYEADMILDDEKEVGESRHVRIGTSNMYDIFTILKSSYTILHLYSGTMGSTADTTAGTHLCTMTLTYSALYNSKTGTAFANTATGTAFADGTISFGKLMYTPNASSAGLMGSAGTDSSVDAFVLDTKVASSGGVIGLTGFCFVMPFNEDL